MEKLLLVGAGGFGRVVLEHASVLYDCAFLDDGEATLVDGVPVIGKADKNANLLLPLSRTDFFPKGDSKRENRCELPRKYHSFRANWSVGSCGNGLEEDVEDYGGSHKLLAIY